jgi:ribosomal protein S18 acetylase RimI-like enzyme
LVTIRPATADDYPAVRDLTHAAYIEAGHIDPASDYAQTLVDMPTRAEGLYVAWVNDQVAGSVNIALPDSAMTEIAYDNELEFRMLAVHPDFQGQGIGRALVTHVLELARDHDLDAVAITTMASMTVAQSMYQAMGFQRAPHRDWNLYTAGYVDDDEGLETFLVYIHPLNGTHPK